MKILLTAFALQLCFFSMAQSDTGIHFEHGKSWADIKALAKAQNKYILVDAYTTWCGPCKYMTKNIFPQKAVGEFYNAKFINAKFQLDTADNDDAAAKAQYADAAFIAKEYKVMAYPTYLFFSPDGNLVHRELGSSDAAMFIVKGTNALDPEKQYYSLVKRYEGGENSPEFLKKLAYSAKSAYDEPAAAKYSAAYLASQTDMFSKENVAFIGEFTKKTSDPGFDLMYKNQSKFDAILGKGKTAEQLRKIILQEKIYPKIFRQTASTPDWNAIDMDLTNTYGVLGTEAASQGKIAYLQQKGDWKNFSTEVSAYIKKYNPNFSAEELNAYAWAIFENCDDAACVAMAVNWSKTSVTLTNNPMFIDTYANLLHKNKRTKEAITWESKAVKLANDAGEDASDYEKNLNKMKRGEKTWE